MSDPGTSTAHAPFFRALVFDVLGTVVDEDASVRQAVSQLLGEVDTPAVDEFAAQWSGRHAGLLEAVRAGERSWSSGDDLRQEALRTTLGEHPHLTPPADAVYEAATVGYRLEPWPDSVAALARLSRRLPVIAMTNGGAEQSSVMSERAGLTWTHLLTADEVERFKPDPAAYRLPLERYDLEPSTTLFVAAHPWDLDGAAGHGYRTALVRRPGVTAPRDAYDLQVGDLGELADRLGA